MIRSVCPSFLWRPCCVTGIRILECILLKVALLLGVEFHCPVEYTDLVEPHGSNGWRVKVSERGRGGERCGHAVSVCCCV